MIASFPISVTRRTAVARVKLGGGAWYSEEIGKFEVLAENPGRVFTRHLKSWN